MPHIEDTVQLCAILLSSVDSRVLYRVGKCRGNVDNLVIFPRCGHKVPALAKGRLATTALLCLFTNIRRVLFPVYTNGTAGVRTIVEKCGQEIHRGELSKNN